MATVYSKSGKKWGHDYEFETIKTLDQVDLNSSEVIYYHHPYDALMDNIPLWNAIDDNNWEHIKKDSKVFLIHDNDSETFDRSFPQAIAATIEKRKINPRQLRVVVMDENHRDFLDRSLMKLGINGVSITVTNYLLSEITSPVETKTPTKIFSVLSRNYRKWRLRFYSELLERGLLDENFVYSFFNIWPYCSPPRIYDKEQMLSDLKTLRYSHIDSSKLNKWLDDCPHELAQSNEVTNKWSNVTYDAILSSFIHVIIETHYDQLEFTQTPNGYDKDFSTSSITEKTYKAIACKRPFISLTTPYCLKDLRRLGFNTYHPYIDETYDVIEDNELRLNYVVNEIERIAKLPKIDFLNMISECDKIAEDNYRILLEKKNA
jgi:hypothetical protein